MQGDPAVIEMLNDHLTFELTATNQYFLNAKMLDNWGLPGLAKLFRDRSFDEMRDAEELIDRILFLDGHPNVQRLNTVRIGEDPVEMIQLGHELEAEAVSSLNAAIELAMDKSDHGTREMLAEMLGEEEEHLDYFESQLDVIARLGEQNYLARYTTPEST
ncbi:bacterioferritin [Salsipaludibacter albus]|uniref:bacterioferritin n=1 Tax=Salsipaludibacter albus TaxID=2849650 RepID=UPI001EE3F8D6|nr:bacterioferritin [Salsipaludibacter albus]MBY5164375.1 bacterioferritin [Salsipaludibacter albus]